LSGGHQPLRWWWNLGDCNKTTTPHASAAPVTSFSLIVFLTKNKAFLVGEQKLKVVLISEHQLQ